MNWGTHKPHLPLQAPRPKCLSFDHVFNCKHRYTSQESLNWEYD